jgi:hypothetical protein
VAFASDGTDIAPNTTIVFKDIINNAFDELPKLIIKAVRGKP